MAVIHPSQIRRPAALQRGHRQQPLASMPAPEEQAKTERERIKARVLNTLREILPENTTLVGKAFLGPA